MSIEGRPVVHMVDKATHFTAALFVKRQTTAEIWRAIRRMLILVYCGPPDYLAIDQGRNYSSREFKEKAKEDGIQIREAPIETPGTIGTVERYHTPLRRAYKSIRVELHKITTNDECLQMATFAVNSVIGLSNDSKLQLKISLTLLVRSGLRKINLLLYWILIGTQFGHP